MTDVEIRGSLLGGSPADGPDTALLPAAIPGTTPDVMPAVLPTAAETVPVAFAGTGSGVAELTWGQREIWLSMMRQGWIRMGGVLPLPPGTTVQDVAGELGYIMSRYQSMRTLVRFDESGRPSQEVFASGEIMLEVYEADDETGTGTGPAETAAAVEAKYLTTIRDFAGEWPVRMAVVRAGGVLTHMVVITCHLASDGAGMAAFSREVQARESAPVDGVQPLELAQWQAGPSGERQSMIAVRNTETVMRSLRPRPLPESGEQQEPRHWSGALTSPALRVAVHAISVRTRADSAAVLQALYAIALGRRGLQNPAVLRPLVSNRFRTGLADVVCNLVQSGIYVLDVGDTTVDEVVDRAKRAGRITYKNSYFDPDQELALIAQIAKEEGPEAVVWDSRSWSYVNDRRANQHPVPTEAELTPEGVRALQGASTFRWTEKKENAAEPLFLYLEETSDSIVVIVSADTHYVSLADNEGIARDMEAIAIEAAFDPAAPTGVAMAPRL
jgi:hypothetical protein